ncbi:CCA tRNA nucleotidyltransferase [Actinomycetospora lutea]|uniref:CCA tRNA nucleotidyltransferase n=1 Tax=Actinomycetospora lutea TaxID=663604 RepID=UPI002366FDF5|nr:CCA tRNA nucleotidyltransferase [Actinomycetospora lutea]MDD7941100.1 CCA tRNA nucleotidyltransferase [Actinomycetospora lutea]
MPGPAPAPSSTTGADHAAVVEMVSYSPVADELARRFADAGHRLYLVGGSVRDALLGRHSTDLDFTTDARPDAIQRLVSGWAEAVWDTGIAYGTVGAVRHGVTCEVTTFRADAYDGVTRNPVVAFGDTVEGDLVRRDFTANAMALSLPDRTFVDPYGGLAALARGVLDTPTDPRTSFGDDPLRLLRAARFVSQLGFEVAPRVEQAMTEMAPELGRITAERVQAELTKLLLGAHPRRGIELMVDTGLADVVLPEVPAMRLEIDEHAQHKDVYEHSLTVMEQAIGREGPDGPDLVLRLAALLHDIGKPATRKVEPGRRVSFHHHEVVGAKMTRKRLRELRYPKQVIEDVAQLVFLHLRFHGYGKGEWTDSAVRRYVTDAGPLLDRLHKLVRSDSTTRNKRRAAALQRSYDDLEERITRIAQEEDLARVRPDLDGNAIMELLGIPPGPLVGRAWRHLKDVRLERGPLDHDEAREELLRWAAAEGIGSAGEPED